MYKASNDIGTRFFKREEDAYDWAIKVIKQTGLKTDIILIRNLHEKQQILYDYIKENKHVKMTLREIGELIGVKSTGHSNHHVYQLIKMGLIKRIGRSEYKIKE